MTVQDLIDELEYLNPETEVRFASQPSWPFEYSISEVVVANVEKRGEEEEVAYLGEGRQIGYLPGSAKEELGW